ncbi:hypothetical protein GE09DRAFT_1048423 [Coniochaeta sp. 2T2.1]|nr:hypothetical protein GE09DRAFT_1048423 [Coniochaeta sp. 2T2.1]
MPPFFPKLSQSGEHGNSGLRIRLDVLGDCTYHEPKIWAGMELKDLEPQIDQWILISYNKIQRGPSPTRRDFESVKNCTVLTFICGGMQEREIRRSLLMSEPGPWKKTLDFALAAREIRDKGDQEEMERDAMKMDKGDAGVELGSFKLYLASASTFVSHPLFFYSCSQFLQLPPSSSCDLAS